jgi:Domain of unknown function (DUF4259)
MGAWGLGTFENDDALDWAAGFRHAPSARLLRDAFAAVIGVDGYLERDPGSYALAAAEVVAAIKGKPCRDMPPALRDWAAANRDVATPDFVASALAAIDRVTVATSSEIAELWAEGSDAPAWAARIDDLRQRLR